MTRIRPWVAGLLGLPLLLTATFPPPAVLAAAPVRVILDGRSLALDPAPVILEDRTLVPLRGLFEAMGATVAWNGDTRTIEVTRGEAYVRLTLGRRLTCLDRDCTRAAVADVPARLIGDRTFVPVRLIAQAMGSHVDWDNDRRAVLIDTTRPPETGTAPVSLTGVAPGERISGPVTLQAQAEGGIGVQFLLLDPATGSGPIVAAGLDPKAGLVYTPDPALKGPRLLVAAVKDAAGALRYSEPVPVTLAPEPEVTVTGLEPFGTIDGPISFSADLTLPATHVIYQLVDDQGGSEELGTAGPGNKLTWYPQVGQNGQKYIQAVAFDRSGLAYTSPRVPVLVQSGYRTVLSGIEEGAALKGPVTLRLSANYPVEAVKYMLDGQVLGWGYNYAWNFGQELNGEHTLTVEATDASGTVRRVGPLHFTIAVTPTARLTGVGPDQVVTGPLSLKVTANVELASVQYWMSSGTGPLQLLATQAPGDAFTWTPPAGDSGSHAIQAVVRDSAGNVLKTDTVKFRVYLGKLYSPVALVPKAEFKDLVVRLSEPVYEEIGMSAALQVAQALLETGHGQSVPVDKYNGKISYNLFGIKGTGPNGTVISNTWEVYGGLSYRVDANFRAYHNVDEAFRDHADFLLVRPWYAPFRAVMSDPVLGAWALKRSGYATDPDYPKKLINIMTQYDLFKLDEVEL